MDTLLNGLESAILKLWNEGMGIVSIALKLGLDEDRVADVVEAPGNYLSLEAQRALCDF